jgi:hypothetical protein
MKNMKKIAIVFLIVVLSGCTVAGKKKDIDIYQEALTVVAMSSGDVEPEVTIINIPSHGVLPDQLVIGLGGGAHAQQLRDILIELKHTENNWALMIGDNPSLDYAVIANAVKELDLTGVQIVYSNKDSKRTKIGQAIKQTGAEFYFIDRQY